MNTAFPYLSPNALRTNVSVDSKKRVIELLSHLLAQNVDGLDQEDIYTALLNRERLGSTGIGHGVALPHARLSLLKQPIAALVCLDHPIHFDAPDDQAVDLFYALLVPESFQSATDITEAEGKGHLETIAKMAMAFREQTFRTALRNAATNQELLSPIIHFFEEHTYD